MLAANPAVWATFASEPPTAATGAAAAAPNVVVPMLSVPAVALAVAAIALGAAGWLAAATPLTSDFSQEPTLKVALSCHVPRFREVLAMVVQPPKRLWIWASAPTDPTTATLAVATPVSR